MKKGFTLIEMIAVIIIMSLIIVTVVPTVLNQVNEKKGDVSNASLEVLYSALDLYIKENSNTYPLTVGNVYCITLEELANHGAIETPYKDAASGNTISLNRTIKATINAFADIEKELLNEDETCTSSI